MGRVYIYAGLFLAVLFNAASGHPPRRVRNLQTPSQDNFVAEGTNELATALLQGFVDSETNQAFSPLGLSALMAILAEGAQGATRKQLDAVLHLPEDAQSVRETYKTVLSRLTEKNVVNRPQFHNWFYIYKNYTVNPSFREILEKHYLTEVKDVEKPDDSDYASTTEEPKKDELLVHQPLQMGDKDYIKVTMPVIVPDQEETEENVHTHGGETKPMEVVKPVTEMIEGDTPITEVLFVTPLPDEKKEVVEEMKIKKPCAKKARNSFQGSQEDMVRRQMMQEAINMQEALGEGTVHKSTIEKAETVDQIEECEEVIAEMEKEVVKSEEVKVEIEEEIKTEEEIKEAMDEKIEKQEAIKATIEKDIMMKEDMISDMQKDMLQNEGVKEIIKDVMVSVTGDETKEVSPQAQEAILEEKLENALSMTPEELALKGSEIKVTVVTMSEEDVKRDAMPHKEYPSHPALEAVFEAEKPSYPVPSADLSPPFEDNHPEPIKFEGPIGVTIDEPIMISDIIIDETHEKSRVPDDKPATTVKDTDIAIEEEKPVKEHVMQIKPSKATTSKKETAKKEEEIPVVNVEHPEDIVTPTDSEIKLDPELLIPAAESTDAKHDVMVAMERSERSIKSGEEIASGLSSSNVASKATSTRKATSEMILFNGLYFRGTWSTPFVRQMPHHGVESFYTTETEKTAVPMMHTEGKFNIGKVPELDSVAIDLPYEGGRYSLLVLLPNSRGGLRQLIGDLSNFRLCDIKNYLSSHDVEVCLPSFEVETTAQPHKTLNKLGVVDVFNQSASDLSSISPNSGLFVQELSQLVTIEVGLTTTQTNFMTASNAASASTRGDAEKFIADHPFLYFVRDVIDDMVIVAGKVVNPAMMPPAFPFL